jgi:hypothetical protein
MFLSSSSFLIFSLLFINPSFSSISYFSGLLKSLSIWEPLIILVSSSISICSIIYTISLASFSNNFFSFTLNFHSTFFSFIFLLIFIAYLAADIYFLYIAFLPYLVEFLCSSSSEVEKALDTNNTSSGGIKDSPLLFDDDNKV